MLVLSRKINESITISNDTVVTIARVQGNRVTLGIEAPKNITIRRTELQERPHGQTTDPGHTTSALDPG